MAETNISSKIAIIGMDCRFPGADNVDQYWNNLIEGRESISFLSREELLSGQVEAGLLDNPAYVKAGSFIEGIEFFDNEFFNYTPREASVIDPQHKLFLESAWHAMEDAGIKPGTSEHRIGVFAGCHMNSYLFNVITNPDVAGLVGDLNVELGNEKDYLATRVSYKLDLRGPSMNIQTACSSSLVAVHMAVQSLLNGECDIALAGGVTINDFERKGYLHQPGGIKSPDGHCRTFDNDAGGTIFGNGLGVVVLKRLEDAKVDGNNIYASIIGTAVNNDGADKVGLAAPGLSGQRDVIEEAIMMAGISPFDLSYIECHGTATRLGDSIEVNALKDVFSEYSGKGEKCGLGAVKTNLGHLNKASGIAGLIKTVLAVKHKAIPPTLHFKQPNPMLELEDSPFYVVDKLVDLSKRDKVLRAGVSSFGVGGTNAHVIVEEVEAPRREGSSRDYFLLPYSGKSKGALARVEGNLYGLLVNNGEKHIEDIEYTLQRGRVFFPNRKFMIVNRDKSIKLTIDKIQDEIFSNGEEELSFASGGVLYSGQIDGAYAYLQHLAETDDYLKRHMAPLVNELERTIGFDIHQPDNMNISIEMVASLSSFILQAVVAKLLADLNIKPEYIAGVNGGELAAACSAGMMGWKDGLLLLLVRGKMLDQSALASLKLLQPEGHLVLGWNRMGSSVDYLSLDYWLQEETMGASEAELVRSCCRNTSADGELLLIHIGMKKDGLKDDKGEKLKVINAIDFIDNQISLLPLMGKLWVNRLSAGFDAYSESHPAHFVSLPVYPFEKTKCWLDLNEAMFQGRSEIKSTGEIVYVPAWQQVRQKRAVLSSQAKCWLFIKGNDRWSEALTQEVRRAGHTVIAPDIGREGNNIADIDNPEDDQRFLDYFTGLRETGLSPDYLVYSLIAETQEMSSSLIADQKDDLYALLRITCAFEAVFNKEARILILSNNVYSVLGEKADNYYASMFQGACTVIPQEFPSFSCLTVDVDSAEPLARTVHQIIDRIEQARGSELLVYRQNFFWKKTYEIVDDLDETTDAPLAIEPDGVYVITGGTGGLGLAVIEYLINRNNPKIAVISRNPTGGQRIDELAQQATELKLFQADVTDAEALGQVFREIRTTMGEIKGGFHLAGLPGKGLILNKKKDELNKVLGPKLEGTLLLGAILKQYNPDFYILFSSMIALKGGNGQVDYCGANSFLDNYALYNTQQGMRTVSINWDAWENTGMMVDSIAPGEGISRQQAADCLDYVLRSLDNPRFIVSVDDVNRLLTQATKPSSPRTEQKIELLSEVLSYEFVFNKLAQLFTLITEEDEIDPEASLDDLGIDSVLILQLFNEIDSVFPGTFSISKLYTYSTLNAITNHICSQLISTPAQKEAVYEPEDSKLADYMNKIKDNDMSIEEVMKYLSGGVTANE